MIEAFDRDEAVAEAIDGLRTRTGLLKGAGALAALLPRAASARSTGTKANDIKILTTR